MDYEEFTAKENDRKISDKSLTKLNFYFEHKTDDLVLHNFDVAFKYNNFYNSEKVKVIAFAKHMDLKKKEWRVSSSHCFD